VYTTDGQELIAFASPVENLDVVAVAVFDATERGGRFRDRIAGGYTQVVDGDGEVQFAADRNETLSQYDGGLSASELQQGRAGQSDGIERGGEIISYAPVAGIDWVLIKHVPQSNAYRLSQLVTDRLLVLIGMTLLGFVLLGGILSRGMIGRLDELSEDASRIADGDLEQAITETDRIDEIGEVQHAFQEIQSYLQTIAEQAAAIANREFEAAVLDDEVPGDIGTALEQMRRDLETSIKKLEQSNENLQEFAYIASHDLQEPLRSVTSYLNLIETEFGDKLDEDGQFYIDRAEDNASRMSSMIDALLQYSRVKSQGGEFVTVDATETVAETVDSLGVLIQETGAEIEYDSLPTVSADMNQLRQLFQNLIKNAIEHGGSPPRAEIQGEDLGHAWQFSVSDNGPGIPQAQQDRIFEIFQQATDDGDDSGESGIGLAICERIASRHHGDIWVESDDDGSTFKFTIDKSIE
jgi:signal transduction histidine kinase